MVRDTGGRNRLEYPIGKVLYETDGWISHPRVSPRGDHVAFLDHPIPEDDSGTVAVVDLAGSRTTLSERWFSEQGLAWSPDAQEILFTATNAGVDRALYATTLSGRQRLVSAMPGSLTLLDTSRDGRLLLTRSSWRREVIGISGAEAKEQDLSWLGYSYPADISADGKTLAFDEEADGGASWRAGSSPTPSTFAASMDPRLCSWGMGQQWHCPPTGDGSSLTIKTRGRSLSCCRPGRASRSL